MKYLYLNLRDYSDLNVIPTVSLYLSLLNLAHTAQPSWGHSTVAESATPIRPLTKSSLSLDWNILGPRVIILIYDSSSHKLYKLQLSLWFNNILHYLAEEIGLQISSPFCLVSVSYVDTIYNCTWLCIWMIFLMNKHNFSKSNGLLHFSKTINVKPAQ